MFQFKYIEERDFTMNKLKLFVLPLAVLSVFTLTGCGNQDNTSYNKLEERVEQLEQEVASLKKASTDNSKNNVDTADSADNTADTAADTSKNATTDTIESLTKAVDEVTAKTDSATPSGNTDEKTTQFFNLKDELDLIDQRLDSYEDYIESQYKQSNLSYDDYRNEERALKELEDKLDASEDKLERTFGIYD